MCKMIKAYELSIGEHRGNKRLWIDSQRIYSTELANNMTFEPIYDTKERKVTIQKGTTHKISSRKATKRAVIDINNAKVTEIFDGCRTITVKLYKDRIEVSPSNEEIQQKIAKSKNHSITPTFLEVFAGGGTLIEPLKNAGLKPVGAVELVEDYLENTEANNPELFTYCGDLAKLDFSLLPDADIVSGGIPCEGYSKSNLRKSKQESHPTGSLGYFFLKIVDHIRPSIVLIEEVPDFGNSSMGAMARYVLRSMGYHISETYLQGTDKGSLAQRNRYCMVASMKKPFVFDETKIKGTKRIKDILEVPVDERVWLTRENSDSIAYLLDKEQKHIEKGDGFRFGRTYLNDRYAVTITKGYYNNRLTDPILVHPEDENKYSWFTPRELARINGLPEDFKLTPKAKGKRGQIIGQGVCYESFYSVGCEIKKHFNSDLNLLDLMECA